MTVVQNLWCRWGWKVHEKLVWSTVKQKNKKVMSLTLSLFSHSSLPIENCLHRTLHGNGMSWIMTTASIWIRILAPARLKVAAAGRSAPSISDFKLEKRLCVTRGLDRRAAWWIGRLGDWWSKGSGQGKVMPHYVNIRLFASHAKLCQK